MSATAVGTTIRVAEAIAPMRETDTTMDCGRAGRESFSGSAIKTTKKSRFTYGKTNSTANHEERPTVRMRRMVRSRPRHKKSAALQ